jgi:hypothetical protein
MATLDVCVVGEINLDLILYGLPKELVLDRELLITFPCWETRSDLSRKLAVMLSGRWLSKDCQSLVWM